MEQAESQVMNGFLKFLPDKPLGLIVLRLSKCFGTSGNVLRRESDDPQCIGCDYTPEGAIADAYIKHGGFLLEDTNAHWDGYKFVWKGGSVSERCIPQPVAEWIDYHHGENTAAQLVAILEAVRQANKNRSWHQWSNEHIADLIKIYFGLSGSMFETAKELACK